MNTPKNYPEKRTNLFDKSKELFFHFKNIFNMMEGRYLKPQELVKMIKEYTKVGTLTAKDLYAIYLLVEIYSEKDIFDEKEQKINELNKKTKIYMEQNRKKFFHKDLLRNIFVLLKTGQYDKNDATEIKKAIVTGLKKEFLYKKEFIGSFKKNTDSGNPFDEDNGIELKLE